MGQRTAPAPRTSQSSACLCMYTHAYTHPRVRACSFPAVNLCLKHYLNGVGTAVGPLCTSLWCSNTVIGKWNNSTTSINLLLRGTFPRETTLAVWNLIKLSPWCWDLTSQLTAYFESGRKPLCVVFFSCNLYPWVKKGLGHVAKHPGAWKA